MFHSQIAAPSARSCRHHRSLRPPPRRAPARFYVVSSGRAGLACAAAAKSCSCSFYSPHNSNMLKRETKCVSIWLGEGAGEAGWGLRKAHVPLPAPEFPGCVRCGGAGARPGPGSGARPGRFGSSRLALRGCCPSLSLGCTAEASPNWRHRKSGGAGVFFSSIPVLPWQGKARIDGNTSSFI